MNTKKLQSWKKGEVIYEIGDNPESAFLLNSGQVVLESSEGIKVGIIKQNEIFGEMGVIEDSLRSAGARCMTDCTVISLSKKEYEKKLNESDPFIKGLLRLLSIRLREMLKPKTLGSK